MLDGVRLVDRSVSLLHEAGCDPVVVVLGAWLGDVPDAAVVVNDDWREGMGSSLRCGLTALTAYADVTRALVTLVDLPGLTVDAVRRLLTDGGDLGAATYSGDRRHPVLLGRDHWDGVVAVATGDRGARDYLAAHAPALVEVGDVASGHDLDVRPDA